MTRHLLHIGYPKAGSMFLRKWFREHPQLAYADEGIAGFRDVWAIAREASKPLRGLPYRVTSSEALALPYADAGQMIVDYEQRRGLDIAAAQHAVCRTLADLFPDAQVLVVTRGYRSMLLSSYSQLVRSGGFVDLRDMLAVLGEPQFAASSPWHYDRAIVDYRRAFGEANVIVMPYELLRDDPQRFVSFLALRLGIDPIAFTTGRINESLTAAELYWYPRFARSVRALRSRRLYSLYARLAFSGSLRLPARLLEAVRPSGGITAADIPDEVLEPFRGTAESLQNEPLFDPYRDEYLLRVDEER